MAEEIGKLEIALGVEMGSLVQSMSRAKLEVLGFETGVAELGKKCIEAAAEAQAATARVAGVFGKLSPEVNEFAEAFGKAAGRAGSDMQAMVATFGGMISPMLRNKEVAAQMSEGLTEMAVNLAKAAHISADEAMGALQGGLAGHGRELMKLGISMDETTIKAKALEDHLDFKSLSHAQKEMVAYQVIMDQAGQVAERAAAQSGTYDEATKQMTASLKEMAEVFGSALLPAATLVVNVLSGLMKIITTMASELAGVLVPAITWVYEEAKKAYDLVAWGIKGGHQFSGENEQKNSSQPGDAESSGGGAISGFFKNLWATLKEDFGPQTGSNAPKIAAVTAAQIKAQGGGPDSSGSGGPSSSDVAYASSQTQQAVMDQMSIELQDALDAQAAQAKAHNAELEKWAKLQEDIQQEIAAANQAGQDAANQANQSLVSSITGAAGNAGQAISKALNAIGSGGLAGGIMSIVTSLIQASAGGQQMLNVLNTIFGMIAGALSPLFSAIGAVLGSIQGVLQPALNALSGVFQALGPLFGVIGNFVNSLMPIFRTLGNVLTTIAGVIGQILNPILQALAPAFTLVGSLLNALMPVFQLLQVPLQLLGMVFSALTPVFQVLGDILRGVGLVIVGIMIGIVDIWNLIAGAVSGVVNGFVDLVNDFINALNSAFGWAGVNISDLNHVDLTATDQNLQNAFTALQQTTDSTTNSIGGMNEAADQATAALTNLPQGYKIALKEFQNMNVAQSGTQGIGGVGGGMPSGRGIPRLADGGLVSGPTLAIVGESGPEMVVPMSGLSGSVSPLSSGGGAGGNIIINATIVTSDPDKLWAGLQQTIGRAQMRRFARPIVGGTRYSTPPQAR